MSLVSLPRVLRSRSRNAWKLVMTILRLRQLLAQVGRHDVDLAVVVVRIVWQQHAQAVADGDARRDDQEGVGEARILASRRSLLSACQAMSIAITTVLPLPVAIFEGDAEAGQDSSPRCGARRSFSIQASPYLPATSAM